MSFLSIELLSFILEILKKINNKMVQFAYISENYCFMIE